MASESKSSLRWYFVLWNSLSEVPVAEEYIFSCWCTSAFFQAHHSCILFLMDSHAQFSHLTDITRVLFLLFPSISPTLWVFLAIQSHVFFFKMFKPSRCAALHHFVISTDHSFSHILYHLIPQSLLFIRSHTNLGNIFGADASISTVEWDLRAENINKNAGSYVNNLPVLLHPAPRSLLFIQEIKIQFLKQTYVMDCK